MKIIWYIKMNIMLLETQLCPQHFAPLQPCPVLSCKNTDCRDKRSRRFESMSGISEKTALIDYRNTVGNS